MLAILDAHTAKVLHLIPSGHGVLIANYFWFNDNRLIAALAIKNGGLDTPTLTGELFAINPDGTHQVDLFGFRSSNSTGTLIATTERRYAAATPIGEQPISDNQILIAVSDFTRSRSGSLTEIEKLDVQNGRTKSVGTAPANNSGLVSDHAGQVRAAYADNKFTGIKLWLRQTNDAPWNLVNDAAKSGVEISPIGFNRDNSKLYVRVSQGDKPDAIELLDMASQQRTKVFQGVFADPGELLPTADQQDYYAIISRDGKPTLHYLDEDSREALLSKGLAVNFPDQLAYFSSFTRDGKRAIVHVASDRNPGDFYLFAIDTHNAQYVVGAEHWINPQQMQPMQPITLAARDGLALHGFLTIPTGSKPYPLVVLPHGGPHGIADEWGYNAEVQMFASHGYAVLQLNYRGSGGYGQKFQQRGYQQWGLSMQDDLTDATQWAIQQGYTRPGRICIYGGSYGGYAAMEGAVREPGLYTCAIGYAGVYDLRVQMDKSDTQETDMGDAYLHRVLGDDRDDLLRRSPLGGVDRIKANILLVHGEADPRVPFKNFREFTKALDDRHKPYESLTKPMEGHGFFLEAHRQEAYEKMLDFLDRNIGDRSVTSGKETGAADRQGP
ncbi:prolyl oligopeptidase family serine peptidase [Rhodanobacter sp. C05]|uniref:alpha/beta hydrolase family protein n=1 Tax=Rhodanobacter sp. C05 TaxID=1945855 RepID=UPI0009C5E3CC|nr:prolyl oligopeptidase family serine peptidase [Rhodanobacter sp. C05]OOG37457.1 hypothetical protein B0E51_16530 [Rhodanobacter sp. C05]